MNARARPLFAYHNAWQALLVPAPDGSDGYMPVPTAVLRELGFTADDGELQRSLPNADEPLPSVRIDTDVKGAAEAARAHRGVDLALRHGRGMGGPKR